MQINDAYKQVTDELLNHERPVKDNINFAILALHESATKIWAATATNKPKDLIRARVASALISVFYVMRELGIDNPEKCLTQKLKELKEE